MVQSNYFSRLIKKICFIIVFAIISSFIYKSDIYPMFIIQGNKGEYSQQEIEEKMKASENKLFNKLSDLAKERKEALEAQRKLEERYLNKFKMQVAIWKKSKKEQFILKSNKYSEKEKELYKQYTNYTIIILIFIILALLAGSYGLYNFLKEKPNKK